MAMLEMAKINTGTDFSALNHQGGPQQCNGLDELEPNRSYLSNSPT